MTVIKRECQNCGQDCGHAIDTARATTGYDFVSRQRDEMRAERDAAIEERDRYRDQRRRVVEALVELVRLKDGPRDDAYRAAKDAAWERARSVVGEQST
jgi:hypothetical protein